MKTGYLVYFKRYKLTATKEKMFSEKISTKFTITLLANDKDANFFLEFCFQIYNRTRHFNR